MIHRPASLQPRRPGRGIPHTRRTLTTRSGLGAFIAAAIVLAPAASAIRLPPPGGGAPPPPPPAITATAHFPLWAVIAMVAATVILSIATTLITLALEHMHRARRITPATAEPQAHAQAPSITAGPETEQGEILIGHYYMAGHDKHADGR